MKQEENVRIIQQAYEEFGRGNIPAILNMLADDVEWTDAGYPDLPFAGNRRGKTQVEDFFIRLNEYVQFTRFEPQSFICEGNTVVTTGYFEGQSKSTSKGFRSDWAMVWKVENGKITYHYSYIDTAAVAGALKA